MNVIWTEDAVRSFSSVDIALAVATDRGLLTPVVRGVDRMSVSALATTTRDLADRAKAGRLRQEELEGGSMSVTNLGMFGTEEFAAIINPPQSAILAVGAVRQEPVVEEGGLAVGSVMRVTLSVDHRPVDGVLAAEWLRVFVSLMERPVQILA
jgi:pyruvate dehydrogenase E2 component (dihydrolipoamide acetyltransferase)